MNSNPLVSCLMVTCDRPRFVLKAVEWFKAQTWARKELVVVDDSRRHLRANLSAERLVRHAVLEDGHDMGAKHNLAVELAQGEVLAYNDDDDLFMPRRLVTQLSPIVEGRVDMTGIPRDLIAYVPSARFVRFKPPARRGAVSTWIGNGIDRVGPDGERPIAARFSFHDGSAMFSRASIPDGVKHPPVRVGQKVFFINEMIAAGARTETVPNNRLFVYVRHGSNTWNYVAKLLEIPAERPRWVPEDAVSFWKEPS
jgi:glycosyltransferase involved in cell wall biosynthesis